MTRPGERSSEERTNGVALEGARLAVHESGRGAPVVALHCSLGSGIQWSALGDQIGPEFKLLAPDFHGCGASDPWPGLRPLRLADEAAVVAALADRAGEPIHLIGHSYGGAVALHAALANPERIASLTLAEPVAFHLLRQGGAAERQLFAEAAQLSDAVVQAVASGDYRAGARRFVDYWSGRGSFAALSERRQAGLAARMPRVAMDFWATFAEQSASKALRRLTMPILLLDGDQSPAPTRRICGMLEDALPTASLVTIPKAGHLAPLTAADEVNFMITSFLVDAKLRLRRRLRASA